MATKRTADAGAASAEGAKPAVTRPSLVGVLQRRRFVEVLTETSSVAEAAAVAGIAVPALYALRDRDEGFAAEWRRALEIGYELIEGQLLAAARGAETKIDTALARQMLQARDARSGRAGPGAAPSGMQVKKVSLAEVEAEVLRLLGAGKRTA